jgi:hypothetical protein
MNAVNNVANFNGQNPVLDPGDAVLIVDWVGKRARS